MKAKFNITSLTTRWLICLLLFYIPSFIMTLLYGYTAPDYNSRSFYISIIIFKIPELLFYLSFFNLKQGGLSNLRFSDAITVLSGIFVFLSIAWIYSLIARILKIEGIEVISDPTTRAITDLYVLPYAFLSMILVGYTEEICFRVIGTSVFSEWKRNRVQTVLGTTAIFTLFHIHQKPFILLTFILGSILSLIFIGRRNIHLNAWIHGGWNFLMLLLNFLIFEEVFPRF